MNSVGPYVHLAVNAKVRQAVVEEIGVKLAVDVHSALDGPFGGAFAGAVAMPAYAAVEEEFDIPSS